MKLRQLYNRYKFILNSVFSILIVISFFVLFLFLYTLSKQIVSIFALFLWLFFVHKTKGIDRKILILGFIIGIILEFFGVFIGSWDYKQGTPFLALGSGWAFVVYFPYVISRRIDKTSFTKNKKLIITISLIIFTTVNYIFGSFEKTGFVLLFSLTLFPLIMKNIPSVLITSAEAITIDAVGVNLNQWIYYLNENTIETGHNLFGTAVSYTFVFFLVTIIAKYLEGQKISQLEFLSLISFLVCRLIFSSIFLSFVTNLLT